MKRLRRWSGTNRAARALVEECEALLSGTYVELCEWRGDPVPVWAWINLLAHGTADQLRAVTIQHARGGRWYHARDFLAGELLDRADAGRLRLPEFQQDVLVPLELELMSCRGVNRWQPGQLADITLRALSAKRSRESR